VRNYRSNHPVYSTKRFPEKNRLKETSEKYQPEANILCLDPDSSKSSLKLKMMCTSISMQISLHPVNVNRD
jgi:hypothetical protein